MIYLTSAEEKFSTTVIKIAVATPPSKNPLCEIL